MPAIITAHIRIVSRTARGVTADAVAIPDIFIPDMSMPDMSAYQCASVTVNGCPWLDQPEPGQDRGGQQRGQHDVCSRVSRGAAIKKIGLAMRAGRADVDQGEMRVTAAPIERNLAASP